MKWFVLKFPEGNPATPGRASYPMQSSFHAGQQTDYKSCEHAQFSSQNPASNICSQLDAMLIGFFAPTPKFISTPLKRK